MIEKIIVVLYKFGQMLLILIGAAALQEFVGEILAMIIAWVFVMERGVGIFLTTSKSVK